MGKEALGVAGRGAANSAAVATALAKNPASRKIAKRRPTRPPGLAQVLYMFNIPALKRMSLDVTSI
jgi:hypothetical protein